MSRLVEIWNGIPGVTAITKFTNRKIAAERIWKAIQNLGVTGPKLEAAVPETAPAQEPAAVQAEMVVAEEALSDAQPAPAIGEGEPTQEVAVGPEVETGHAAAVAQADSAPGTRSPTLAHRHQTLRRLRLPRLPSPPGARRPPLSRRRPQSPSRPRLARAARRPRLWRCSGREARP
jgi:hypothetical protein